MEEKILKEVLKIYDEIERNGFEVFFVGGCIRNLLMDIPVKDWDLTTSAAPEEIVEPAITAGV